MYSGFMHGSSFPRVCKISNPPVKPWNKDAKQQHPDFFTLCNNRNISEHTYKLVIIENHAGFVCREVITVVPVSGKYVSEPLWAEITPPVSKSIFLSGSNISIPNHLEIFCILPTFVKNEPYSSIIRSFMLLLIANKDPDAAAEFFVPRIIMVMKSEQNAV